MFMSVFIRATQGVIWFGSCRYCELPYLTSHGNLMGAKRLASTPKSVMKPVRSLTSIWMRNCAMQFQFSATRQLQPKSENSQKS